MPDLRGVLDEVVAAAGGVELELAPLGELAAARVLEVALGEPPDAEFAHASYAATGGNPFLLTELARAMRDAGIAPRAADASRVESMAPRSVVRSIAARLRRLPKEAQALARAAAVFGMEVELRHAAALADLDPATAADAADALFAARLVAGVDPLRFEHALTRTALLAEAAPGRLAHDHGRAAEILAEEDAAADRVASHLLATPPSAREKSVRWLRRAAELAMHRGAPAAAIPYLERALAEPPPMNQRWEVLWQLGRAELGRTDLTTERAAAVQRLEAAMEACTDQAQRPHLALDLGEALVRCGRLHDAYVVLTDAIDRPGCDELEVTRYLEATLLTHGQTDNELARRLRPRVEALMSLRGDTYGERTVLAIVAYIKANDGSPQEVFFELARRALRDASAASPDRAAPFETFKRLEWLSRGLLARALATFGDAAGSQRILDWSLEVARAQGSVEMYSLNLVARSALEYTVGEVDASAEDAATAIDLALETGSRRAVPLAASMRLATSIERGEHEQALALLARLGLLGPMPEMGVLDVALFFRGVLRGESGDVEGGIEDLFELGRRERAAGHKYPFTQWRVGVAPFLAAAGRRDEAHALLDEELEVSSRRGAARPLGAALRALGTLEQGEAGIGLLRRSAALLDASPFRLEAARTAVELGVVLRRAQHRAEARSHLERGMELAFRCGATVLTARAHEELAAVGARPRRMFVTGPASLTATERRVADLAAAGQSNPEIAQALFVSRKTVETHLGRVYQKLSINNRSELADALRASDG